MSKTRAPLVIVLLAAAGLLGCGGDDGGGGDSATACQGRAPLDPASLLPEGETGTPLPEERLSAFQQQLPAGAEIKGLTIKGSGGQLAVITFSSTTERLPEDELFAGFTSGAPDAEDAPIGGTTGRAAVQGGATTVIGLVNECAAATVAGSDDAAARDLAERLVFD